MPKARSQQISLSDTPYYHCVSRCVRRAFLCGYDELTGKSYEHRRSWVEQRLLKLGQVFSIDVCAFAVIHNHTHLVLHVDQKSAMSWSIDEVLTRWHMLFSGMLFTQQYLNGDTQSQSMLFYVKETAEIYRKRLTDISWFMRALNEPIAREANKEDNCTGRFWEGRFKSQPLLDEPALVACMAYVDLNPIRATIEKTPETSEFTSIKLRIKAAINGKQPTSLLPFIGNSQKSLQRGLPFNFDDYIQLIELTGKILRKDKRGVINRQYVNMLDRLNVTTDNWLILSQEFEQVFKGAVGTPDSISRYCQNMKFKRRQGINISIKLLTTP